MHGLDMDGVANANEGPPRVSSAAILALGGRVLSAFRALTGAEGERITETAVAAADWEGIVTELYARCARLDREIDLNAATLATASEAELCAANLAREKTLLATHAARAQCLDALDRVFYKTTCLVSSLDGNT